MRGRFRGLFVLFCAVFALRAQDLKEFEKRVTEFTLGNGLHFIVFERHQAPVVSFHTYVNAGSVDDPKGETGLAHMFEHMAFKGTDRIGTRNYAEEKRALEAVERAYDRLDAERARGARADAQRIAALEADLAAAMDKAGSYVDPNAYPRIIEENGGVGLNASTGVDSTDYFYSLPSNRVELWFLLESQRFLHPVFREFYKERDVVREERRSRIESSPPGKLMEMLLATSFAAHPYREPTAGWASDIENLRVEEARAFYDKYYVPANITIGIAGDVSPAQVKRLADQYFSLLPARPLPRPLVTVEPAQEGAKSVEIETPSQPLLAIVYKRPSQTHKDDPVFDVINGVLDAGRTGLLYRELVRDKRIALSAQSAATFPSGAYPNLFLIFVAPSQGHTIEENEKAVYQIIERLKTQTVDEQTLQRVRTKVRAGLIRQLDSNSGMASQLTFYHVNYGDWRKLFTGLDDINRVTAADVQRVARQYFTESARTVARTVAPRRPGAPR
ncbi:MAG: M16 family metallopeptidase [Acidobacteriota bacterium]